MPYSPEIYQAATLLLERRRDEAEHIAERRRAEIYDAIPEIRETDGKLSMELSDISAALLRKGADTASVIDEIRAQCSRMNARRAELLKKNGYPENYLEPPYSCSKCSDTGRVDGVLCDCYKEVCRKLAAEELDKSSGAAACSFDNFSLNFYEDSGAQGAANPRVMMTGIYNSCRNYAENFSGNSPSILMIGKTGLGKTHLSLSIAGEVIGKGFNAVYNSAQNIFTELNKEHFGRSDSSFSYEAMILDCDLLLIDDLGAEFSTQFTNAALYNIINTRMNYSLPTIINTNLSLKEIEEKYTRRISSRIIGEYAVLDFFGYDVRQLKNE